MFANIGDYTDGRAAVRLAQTAEEAGFDSVWAIEHVVVPAGYESTYPYDASGRLMAQSDDVSIPDPLIWLSWVGAATTRVKLCTGVMILPQRNPVVLAKEVATLDSLSEGRVNLGVGVGWLAEEFQAIGVPFEARGPRTDDYIAAMRALWQQDRATHHGDFTDFDEIYLRPQPAAGTVPVVIGGHTEPAARRAGRLGDGFFPARDAPADLIALARKEAEKAGRDPAKLEITASMPEDMERIPALAQLGVTRLLVPATPMAGLKQMVRGVEDVAKFKEVIERYRTA
jgi:probable F420-dependent oxidoreductase